MNDKSNCTHSVRFYRPLLLLLAIATLVGVACAARPTALPSFTTPTPAGSDTVIPSGSQSARVLRIVDGDTIEIDLNGQMEKVRYVGIDTPERGQPGYRAATEANRALIENRTIYLIKDVTDRDRGGRLLRYVYRADNLFVNAELVVQGWAQPVDYQPDVAQSAHLRALAVAAAKAKRGFWSGASAYDGAMSYALAQAETALHKGPGVTFPVSRQIAPDTPLTIFGRTPANDWVQVRTPERAGGWVSPQSLLINVDLSTIPIPDELPAVIPTDNSSSTHSCPGGCKEQPAADCAIKGNVNSKGERIYHLADSPSYGRIVMKADEGDRWFCTEAEAQQAGFRAPR